jgi:hypothetical protein
MAPTALYGIVLLFSGAAYTILLRAFIREQGAGSKLAAAVGRDTKGLVSVATYVVAIVIAFFSPVFRSCSTRQPRSCGSFPIHGSRERFARADLGATVPDR